MNALPTDSPSDRIMSDERLSSTPITGGSDSKRARKATVLLASARRSLVNWARVTLATAGLSLMISPDGLHALMSAVSQPPELVILDDELPGVAADYVEQMLSRDARTTGVRVIHVNPPPDES